MPFKHPWVIVPEGVAGYEGHSPQDDEACEMSCQLFDLAHLAADSRGCRGGGTVLISVRTAIEKSRGILATTHPAVRKKGGARCRHSYAT
jgi:hypothetical protein